MNNSFCQNTKCMMLLPNGAHTCFNCSQSRHQYDISSSINLIRYKPHRDEIELLAITSPIVNEVLKTYKSENNTFSDYEAALTYMIKLYHEQNENLKKELAVAMPFLPVKPIIGS